jgi:predicted patatin/cPLA2 family phospholipase
MFKVALEGGGARSSFSAGVLAELDEAGVPITTVIGSSSGCINASFLASGQIEHVCELWPDPQFTPRLIRWDRFLNPFGGPGIAVDDLCFGMLKPQNEIDLDALYAGPINCFFTLTDVDAAKAVAMRPKRSNFYEWLCASMAIPVAYNRVVEVDGGRYVDGGVTAPIPFDIETGASGEQHTIAIITRPFETNKPRPSFWQRALIRTIVPDELKDIVLDQHNHHNKCLERVRAAQKAGTLHVLSPPDSGIPSSRLTRDPDKLRETVEIGRQVGREWVEANAGI